MLTLMFVPVEQRQALVASIHDALEPGGTLIMVEKVLGGNAELTALLVKHYHRLKRANGSVELVWARLSFRCWVALKRG